jgi:ribonucleoside-diphosphate reductase alpha chain
VIYYEEKDSGGPVVEYVSEAQYEQEPAAQTVRPRIEAGWGPILSRDTPVGRIHMSIRHHPETDEPYDVFINSGKGDVGADVQAIARLISMILRWPNDAKINQRARLEMIRTQLYRIPGRSQVGFGKMAVHSLPDGVSNIIQQYLNGDYPTPQKKSDTDQGQEAVAEASQEVLVEAPQEDTNGDEYSQYFDICPACHTTSFLVAPGRCSDCKNCGYSSC